MQRLEEQGVYEAFDSFVANLITCKAEARELRAETHSQADLSGSALANAAIIEADDFQRLVVDEKVLEHALAVHMATQVVFVHDRGLDCVVSPQGTDQGVRSVQVEPAVGDVEVSQLRPEDQAARYNFNSFVLQWIAGQVEPLDIRVTYRLLKQDDVL